VTKGEEKAEFACIASVFNSDGSCSLHTQPPEQEDRDGEQKESPKIQGEMVSDLLYHIDTHKSMGLDGIHPVVLKELADVLAKPYSIICQQSWLTGEVPVDWSLANVTPIYKKGQKEDRSRELQACQSDLSAGKGYGADYPECCHVTHTGQQGDQAQSEYGFTKGRSCLTNPISFYDKVARVVNAGRTVDIVYLYVSKALTLAHSTLLEKLAANGFNGCALCWVKNWLDGQAQRVVVHGVKSIWWPLTTGVPQS